MDLNLKGKSVVVTGGTLGIGKAIALAFVKEGCSVSVCSRNPKNIEATIKEFEKAGYSILAKPADVTNYDSICGFRDKVMDRLGKINIWINNAGSVYYKLLMDYEIDEWHKGLDINLNSVFLSAKAIFPIMKKAGGGVIINASSYAAVTPRVGKGCYAAAKSGMLSLTRSLAGELAPYNIRVVSYMPGPVTTPLTAANFAVNAEQVKNDLALKRIGKPEEIASFVVFMASDAASFMTGTHIEISGGKLCVQNPMDAWAEAKKNSKLPAGW